MIKFCCSIAAWGMLLSVVTGSIAHAQQTGETVPMDPEVTIGKLPNGFTYYIRKNTTPEKRAVMYLVNKAGSILETDEQRGLAHFLEHMAFNGTTHYPKNELVNYLQKSGVRFGADLNAYTGFDETVYQLPVSVEDKTVFRNAMQIMRDWAQELTLSDEEIDNERGVILEEKRQRLGSAQRIQDKVMPLSVNQSLYASRLPIGTEEVLKNFKHEQIRAFYKDWYRPDLQALIVVGDVNVAQIEKSIRAMFADLRSPAQPKERKYTTIPLTGKNQFLAVTDPEVATTRLELTIKQQGATIKTKTDFSNILIQSLFNSMVSDRMNEVARQKNAPFLSGGAGFGKMMANLSGLSGRVVLKPGETEKGIKAWWTEIQRIKKYGFTEGELQRAKTSFLSNVSLSYKERDKTPSESYVREYVKHFLEGEASPGSAYETALYKAITDTLTLKGFNAVIQSYFKDTDRDLILVANDKQKDSLPSEATVLQWMNEAATASIAAYEDKKVLRTTLLDSAPQPGTIISEKVIKDLGITSLELSNGLKVLLKPTSFKKDEILFNGFSRGGLSQVSDADFYNASIAASLVSASGVSDMTQAELRKLLTGKNVSVSPFISETSEGISGGAADEDLETALQLVYLYFTSPRKDPVMFSNMIEQARLSYANANKAPRQLYSDTLNAVMANYHFRKMQLPEQQLNLLDADQALAIYKNRFADAAGFIFTFVGNFNTDSIKPLLVKYLGSLPALHKQEDVKDLQLNYPQGRVVKKVVAGKEPQAIVTLAFSGSFPYDITTSDQMKALAGVLNIRLTERLREQEAGVYSVNVNANTRKVPSGEYMFGINFICDPRNVETLILSVNSEIMKLKTTGVAEDDVVKYKAGYKSSVERAFKENGFWLNYIASTLLNREPLQQPDIKDRLQQITPETLQQTAVKYFNNANYIRAVLVPESN
ncbi:insulinase family protein [Chitinophaga ginsengisegetis]|uniref:M16 family metallopeptidase n=1 Tax=Chitinophaga ginsengisegetis TaxID=393003 RepID=UPI003441BA17